MESDIGDEVKSEAPKAKESEVRKMRQIDSFYEFTLYFVVVFYVSVGIVFAASGYYLFLREFLMRKETWEVFLVFLTLLFDGLAIMTLFMVFGYSESRSETEDIQNVF